MNKETPYSQRQTGDAALEACMVAAREYLLGCQNADGHWVSELIVDASLCADVVLFMHWADRAQPGLEQKCIRRIRAMQLPGGGWNIYHGGPAEINVSVKSYFALKLAGAPMNAPHMREARAEILRLGGIPRLNSYAKSYLALLGQFPWKYVPSVPAEMILFPNWMFFNLYEMSSWSRAMLVPLSIISHFKPTRIIPVEKGLAELYPAGTRQADFTPQKDRRFWAWRNFFLRMDALLKLLHRFRPAFLRRIALRRAEAWMRERMGEGSDGLGAVFPAMLNALIAFRSLGIPEDDPVHSKALSDFETLFVEDAQGFRIQPCLSPVWDTAINMIALAESGLPPTHPALQSAADWLLAREVRTRGDWAVRNPRPEPGGWAFEYQNRFYPDTDDTMMVLMALRLVSPTDRARHAAAMQRGLSWLLSFQCRNGGWAAFDKNLTRHWLEDVPFADHRAILDPTCSDLTGRTLELLGRLEYDRTLPFIQKALHYLRKTQESDGSWYGRWGVNYLYGTWQVLRGLDAIGEPMDRDWIIRARDWIESCQNEDGGWGETPASYEDSSLKGTGPSTPSQTAWALMALCACGDWDRPSITGGAARLIRTQLPDGSWEEKETTGTGFPKVFYLKYDSYRINWPLLALATLKEKRQRDITRG